MVENLKRYYAGVEYAYPSRESSPRIFRVTFWDNKDLDVYKFFEKWKGSTAYGPSRMKALPENFQRDITIKLKDEMNVRDSTIFNMYDCYPTEISEATLSYESSELFNFDVLFYFRDKEIG